jgi:hypothetical protein
MTIPKNPSDQLSLIKPIENANTLPKLYIGNLTNRNYTALKEIILSLFLINQELS